jgi:signal peptidase I
MRKVPLSKKQKRAEKIKKTLIHVGIWFLGLLIVIALGVFAVRGFGIKTVIIDQSMNPTLQNEDVVLLNKLSYKIGSPKRMDVVAVRIGASENSPTYVRRIIGLPGETVQIKDGKVYIDDTELELTFNDAAIENAGVAEKGETLGDNEYFVLCDDYNNNRDDSRLDSIGTIDSDQILGKVWLIRSPLSRLGLVH